MIELVTALAGSMNIGGIVVHRFFDWSSLIRADKQLEVYRYVGFNVVCVMVY